MKKYLEIFFILIFTRPAGWEYEKRKWRRKYGLDD